MHVHVCMYRKCSHGHAKLVQHIHTENGLLQTDLDPTHSTMSVVTGLAMTKNVQKLQQCCPLLRQPGWTLKQKDDS